MDISRNESIERCENVELISVDDCENGILLTIEKPFMYYEKGKNIINTFKFSQNLFGFTANIYEDEIVFVGFFSSKENQRVENFDKMFIYKFERNTPLNKIATVLKASDVLFTKKRTIHVYGYCSLDKFKEIDKSTSNADFVHHEDQTIRNVIIYFDGSITSSSEFNKEHLQFHEQKGLRHIEMKCVRPCNIDGINEKYKYGSRIFLSIRSRCISILYSDGISYHCYSKDIVATDPRIFHVSLKSLFEKVLLEKIYF